MHSTPVRRLAHPAMCSLTRMHSHSLPRTHPPRCMATMRAVLDCLRLRVTDVNSACGAISLTRVSVALHGPAPLDGRCGTCICATPMVNIRNCDAVTTTHTAPMTHASRLQVSWRPSRHDDCWATPRRSLSSLWSPQHTLVGCFLAGWWTTPPKATRVRKSCDGW